MIVLWVALVASALFLFALSATTLHAMLYAWRSPGNFEATAFTGAETPRHSFSVIVPCRAEEYAVMTATVTRLVEQSHPSVQVVISVGDDDVETVALAHRIAAEAHGNVIVSVNTDPVKNKPRQLNSALHDCTGDIVGIMDAESLAAPDLLRHVDATFQVRDADIVQGAVHLVNFKHSWFTLRNCLEYRIWFRSRLHGHANSGFIPLGGNTVFMKRAMLVEVGGWDGDCLAEDCEIGVRLSVLGKKVVCAYDPHLTTLEEAPESIRQLVKQRTRWALGFMQVLSKGEWKKLPTRRQRISAWWTLVQQYAMAFTGLVLPIAVVTALVFKVPTPIALLTYLPLVPSALTVAFEMLALREFSTDMGLRVRVRDYVKLVLSTAVYQSVLAVASLRAVFKYVTGDFGWEKTSHTGAHLRIAATVDDAVQVDDVRVAARAA